MALLNQPWLVMGVAASSLGAAPACSLVYDTDSLEATRLDTTSDTPGPGDTGSGDAGDSAQPDVADLAGDTPDPPEDTADTLTDTAPDAIDDTAPDAIDDTAPGETVDAHADTPPDDAGSELVLRHTGEGGCTLDYYLQAVTACPKACAWDFRIDASESIGISNVTWRFSVTGGYSISPSSGAGLTEDVSVLMPSCTLFGSESVGPASLLVEAAVDGAPMQLVDKIDFAVRLVSSCPSTPRADCLDPR